MKKEASALEGMKAKLKEMDELKRTLLDLRARCKKAEADNADLQVATLRHTCDSIATRRCLLALTCPSLL